MVPIKPNAVNGNCQVILGAPVVQYIYSIKAYLKFSESPSKMAYWTVRNKVCKLAEYKVICRALGNRMVVTDGKSST